MVTGNRVATVADLRAHRIERLRRELTPLLSDGHVTAEVSGIGSVDEWRAAARSAARNQGWRVRTGVGSDGSHVWAVRLDLGPSTDGIGRWHVRQALNSLSARLVGNPAGTTDPN